MSFPLTLIIVKDILQSFVKVSTFFFYFLHCQFILTNSSSPFFFFDLTVSFSFHNHHSYLYYIHNHYIQFIWFETLFNSVFFFQILVTVVCYGLISFFKLVLLHTFISILSHSITWSNEQIIVKGFFFSSPLSLSLFFIT